VLYLTELSGCAVFPDEVHFTMYLANCAISEKRSSFGGLCKLTNTFRILPVYMLYQSQESSGSVVCKRLDDQDSLCARDKIFFSLLLICTGSGADYLAPCF